VADAPSVAGAHLEAHSGALNQIFRDPHQASHQDPCAPCGDGATCPASLARVSWRERSCRQGVGASDWGRRPGAVAVARRASLRPPRARDVEVPDRRGGAGGRGRPAGASPRRDAGLLDMSSLWGLRSHLFIVPDGAGARRCAAAFVVGSPTARAMSRVRWLARRSCGVGSVVRPVYCRRCRESLDIGAPFITGGFSTSLSQRSACLRRCSVVRSARSKSEGVGCMDQDDRDDKMLGERLSARSVPAIAKQYRCATSEVDAVIDRRLNFDLTNDLRRKSILLDTARLEALMAPFFERATKDRDVQAGTLCVKILERRALLLGLDQPTQSRVDVYQIRPPDAPSSYQKSPMCWCN